MFALRRLPFVGAFKQIGPLDFHLTAKFDNSVGGQLEKTIGVCVILTKAPNSFSRQMAMPGLSVARIVCRLQEIRRFLRIQPCEPSREAGQGRRNIRLLSKSVVCNDPNNTVAHVFY